MSEVKAEPTASGRSCGSLCCADGCLREGHSCPTELNVSESAYSAAALLHRLNNFNKAVRYGAAILITKRLKQIGIAPIIQTKLSISACRLKDDYKSSSSQTSPTLFSYFVALLDATGDQNLINVSNIVLIGTRH